MRFVYLGCGLFGSLTINCNLVDDRGMIVPPADFIAAVEPVAVQIRNPLERE